MTIKRANKETVNGCPGLIIRVLWRIFCVLVVVFIALMIATGNPNKEEETDISSTSSVSSFTLGRYDTAEISIAVDEHDRLTFYVEPASVQKEELELVNSNESAAKCLLQDVRMVNGNKLAIVSCCGLSVGEATIYLKDKNSDTKSQEIHITVSQKAEEETDTSRTVYLNSTGNKYHYSESCAGKSAYESTLNKARTLQREPCGKCVH